MPSPSLPFPVSSCPCHAPLPPLPPCTPTPCREHSARLQGELERAAQQQAELSSSVERLEAEAAQQQKVGTGLVQRSAGAGAGRLGRQQSPSPLRQASGRGLGRLACLQGATACCLSGCLPCATPYLVFHLHAIHPPCRRRRWRERETRGQRCCASAPPAPSRWGWGWLGAAARPASRRRVACAPHSMLGWGLRMPPAMHAWHGSSPSMAFQLHAVLLRPQPPCAPCWGRSERSRTRGCRRRRRGSAAWPRGGAA